MSKFKYHNGTEWVGVAPSQQEFDDFKTSTLSELAEKAKKAWIDVTDAPYNAMGDGTDDTTKIQSALDVSGKKIVIFPSGKSFKVNTLLVPNDTTIIGYGAKLYNTETHQTILKVGSGVKIYGLEIQGAGNNSFDAAGIAVDVSGSYDATLGTINWKNDIIIEDCYFHDLGSSGVLGEYSSFVKVVRVKIENVGRNGVLGNSVKNWIVDDCYIKGISPGTSSSISGESVTYGVAFSKQSSTNEIQYPRSKDCTVRNCTIEDNLIWEALDTHGGINISFEGNTIRNCKHGIAIVPISVKVNGYTTKHTAPHYCRATNNYIELTGDGSGIVVQGAYNLDSGTGVVDFANPLEYAKSCVVSDNVLIKCGENGNNTRGAMYLRETYNLVVSGNALEDCYTIGLNLYYANKGFSVTGNTVKDVRDTTYATPIGIAIRANYNTGTISGNTTIRENAGLDVYVSVRGIGILSAAGNNVTIGLNHSSSTVPLYGVSQANGGNLMPVGQGDAFIFTGFGTPEGVVTAKKGSLYINISAGTGTTLYVKETGDATNTGWVAK